MRLLRVVRYDINEGIIKYWYKWIMLFVIQIVNCCTAYQGTDYIRQIYGGIALSATDIGIYNSMGRFPYLFNSGSPDTFYLPFTWIIQYLILAYIVGGYVKEDMHGYGTHLMIKSRKRYIWWLSKSIWCVGINTLYFGMTWIINTAFSWAVSGKEVFKPHATTVKGINEYMFGLKAGEMFVVVLLIPLLVGIAHSMLQIIISMCFGDEVSMVVIGILLVVTSYYSNRLLPSGYSMTIRYNHNMLDPGFDVLNYRFGLVYLIVLIVLLHIVGAVYVKKKNLYQ